ncbi:restriction endonuclease subunit S [Bacteroides fragilis]|uniref:restriction endonuclease subunit S n=1 Tax=Bacteroides TaxID=816 RepID=UPI001E3D5E09|nr:MULTISPECIES: restriction endonuclease subunit S [Bacteroides]MDC2158037.1 restriction endonuclease subunit S [Bacteroides thetaiotaomicron]
MRKYKLGDIATVEISGVDKKIKDGEKEIRLCNFVDVYYNWAITTAQHDSFMLATARPNEISKFKLKKGQVALTKDSETRDDIGIPTYIADGFDDAILGYHCALVTPNKDILDGRYLNALLHTDYAKKYFACNASGSGQRYALSVEALNSFPVPIIPLHEQKQIGEIFSALDKKIELNKRINQNLEAMAKQLYDYWFVQFDFPNEEGKPYKSSGGTMVWNEKLKRFIPKGWESTTLGNECHMYQPKTLGLSELDEAAKYKVYGANGVIGKYHTYNHENSEIAMACRGNSCGTVNRTAPFSWITGNAMVIKMIDGSIHNEYIKQALQYANVDGAISGSGQPQLTRENLNSIKLCKPTRELIIRFSEQVSNIVEMYLQNESNIEELTKQRDELLPLLMNGQVSVNSDLPID